MLGVGTACDARRDVQAADKAAVQASAVSRLFLEREHARSIELWADTSRAGPIFTALGVTPAVAPVPRLASVDGAIVRRVTSDTMARIFRDSPDGWEGFFRRYPASSGLVELSAVTFRGDSLATVIVGRSCGEHCAVAWRVSAVRTSGGAWTVATIDYLPVPVR
jgi:hypothetical protein